MSYAVTNQTLLTDNNQQNNTLIWAIVGSLLLHALLAIFVPNLKFDIPLKETPKELQIELVQPAPTIAPQPSPAPPEEIKPVQTPEPIPQKVIPKPQKMPDALPPPTTTPSTQVNDTPPPAVIAAEAKAESKPALVVPAPPPPPPPQSGPTEEDINAARSAYINSVQRELRNNIKYPSIAQRRNIQGEAKVEIQLDREGNVTSVQVVESTGNDALDKEAIEVVKRSNLKRFMKEILFGHLNKITVPVSFILTEN